MSPEEMSQATLSLQNRFRGCLLGLASGDAVGTTVEFQRRGTFAPVDQERRPDPRFRLRRREPGSGPVVFRHDRQL